MAVITGQRFTYSDTVNERIDMSSALDVLRPTDVPLLRLIGRDSLRDPCTNVKHEWLEDDLRALQSTITDNPLASNATTVNVAAGTGVLFRAHDIVKIEDELLRVTVVATDALTVTRAWGGSTAVAHVQNTVIMIVAPALPQGSDLISARTTTKAALFNYTQIFEEEVKVSATNQATAKYTKQNDPEYQIGNHLELLGINMERTLLYGRKAAASSGLPGTMDGIIPRLTTNVYDKNGAALTETMVLDAMQAIWTAGARALTIVSNATQKRRINTFADAFREMPYGQTQYGATVQRFDSDFGEVKLLLDRHIDNTEILILDETRLGFGPLQGRALSTVKLPMLSKEYDVWQISGEYTSEVRLEKAHARIYDLATTGLF